MVLNFYTQLDNKRLILSKCLKEKIMKKKIIKYILIGILIYVTVTVIEFGCFYAVQGEDIWDNLKKFWCWYKKVL